MNTTSFSTDPAASADEPETNRATARRILVVDDNTDAAEMLGALLETFGFDVEIAADGPSALALVERFRPGAAVLDIGLPGMDGYELARRLRAAGHDDIDLIALTGYGQAGDRERSKHAGFAAHLVKPVELDQLVATLASLQSGRD